MDLPPVAHGRTRNGKVELQTLEEHSDHVGYLAGLFAAKIGCPLVGELLGLLHDLGKNRVIFKRYILSALGILKPGDDAYIDWKPLKGKIDHATAGAQLAWQRLAAGDKYARAVAQIVALAVASHHSGMIDCIKPPSSKRAENRFATRMNKPEEEVQLAESLALAERSILGRIEGLIADPLLVQEVAIALDRVRGMNSSKFCLHLQLGFLARFLFSCLIAADRRDTAAYERGENSKQRPILDYEPWSVLIKRLEVFLDNKEPDPEMEHINTARREISESCKDAALSIGSGVYSLTVPTAGGKTLASLRFALHHAEARGLERIIYVIPYTSIIDQNANVARKVLEPSNKQHDQPVVLEHHSNLAPEEQTELETILTDDWDAPVVFTTMVQFLESFFGGGTRGVRRMHQLARSVIVFDEVQTLPVRCVHLFNNAINFLAEQCDSTVLLCTATQPLLGKVDEERGVARLGAGAELIPNHEGYFDRLQRVRVHVGQRERSYEEIADLAVRQLQRHGNCLVVVNTKTSAERLFKICRDIVPSDGLFHLSTSMCPAHRMKLIGEKDKSESDSATIIGRLHLGLPTLCISTQLVEAGIDIDFNSAIRFLAGIDSIAQAAGRCNRNARLRNRDGEPTRGSVYVVRSSEERLGSLEEIRMGQEMTLRVLSDFADNPERFNHDLIGPEAVRLYYRYYFFERSEEMVYPLREPQLSELDYSSETLLRLLSTNRKAAQALGDESDGLFLKQSFQTAAKFFSAIEAPTEGVVVPYGDEGRSLVAQLQQCANDPKQLWKLLRHAQRYSVSLYPRDLDQLEKSHAVEAISDSVSIRVLMNETYYDDRLGMRDSGVWMW
jgi:CRISPR-associated endonuclease/helicase Cas3